MFGVVSSSELARFPNRKQQRRTLRFTYDYAECAVHGCEDFNIDWLKEVGCLRSMKGSDFHPNELGVPWGTHLDLTSID